MRERRPRTSTGDERLGPVLLTLAGIVAAVAVAAWGAHVVLEDAPDEGRPASFRAKDGAGDVRRLPEPRLLADPPAALRELHAWETGRLGGYAWVDRETRRVRVPLERAFRIALQRGFPVREREEGR